MKNKVQKSTECNLSLDCDPSDFGSAPTISLQTARGLVKITVLTVSTDSEYMAGQLVCRQHPTQLFVSCDRRVI